MDESVSLRPKNFFEKKSVWSKLNFESSLNQFFKKRKKKKRCNNINTKSEFFFFFVKFNLNFVLPRVRRKRWRWGGKGGGEGANFIPNLITAALNSNDEDGFSLTTINIYFGGNESAGLLR